MIRYPAIHIIFLAGLAALIFISLWYPLCLIFTGLWFGLFLALLIAGSMRVCSGMYVKVLCRASIREKLVALTFDDGPHKELTARVLDILREHDIRAAFFIKGREAAACPDIVNRMHNEGHVIGNHSWSHDFWFDLFSVSRMENEIRQTDRIILDITGKNLQLFRPPYGVTNPGLAKALKRGNHYVIGWNIRSRDTMIRHPEKIAKRVEKMLQPGSIILLHDNLSAAPDILESIISVVKQNGYNFAGIDALFNFEPHVKL